MTSTTPAASYPTAPRGWWLVGQILLTLTVLAAMVPWALLALVLAVLQCDDGCSPGQDYSQYSQQGVLAAIGLLLAAVSLGLGFSRHRGAFWVTLLAAAMVGLVWWGWVSSGGF